MTRRLVYAWLGLMLLLALTVGSSFIPLGVGNSVVNLAIAVAKATIVLAVFMELRRGEPLLHLAAAAVGFWLLILFVLSWIALRGV